MPNVIDKIVEANTTSRRFERHQWHVNIVSCWRILILAFVNYNSNLLIDFEYFPVDKMTE